MCVPRDGAKSAMICFDVTVGALQLKDASNHAERRGGPPLRRLGARSFLLNQPQLATNGAGCAMIVNWRRAHRMKPVEDAAANFACDDSRIE